MLITSHMHGSLSGRGLDGSAGVHTALSHQAASTKISCPLYPTSLCTPCLAWLVYLMTLQPTPTPLRPIQEHTPGL